MYLSQLTFKLKFKRKSYLTFVKWKINITCHAQQISFKVNIWKQKTMLKKFCQILQAVNVSSPSPQPPTLLAVKEASGDLLLNLVSSERLTE